MASRKRNAPSGGARSTKLAGGVDGQIKIVKCTNNHISKLRRRLHAAGLLPNSTKTETQLDALLKILLHLGEAGLNTPEGTGIAFARLATRVWDLEMQGWRIDTLRENVITADGLLHRGIARYVLRGRRIDFADPQSSLDLGEQQP
jgi:hypothetical protein